MEYTVLGRTGLRVSRVGCGGGGIGQVWGPTTEAESVRTIHRALELGVNFFDVAPGYGQGKAEEVLGRALHERREQVVVATKVRLAAEEMHDVAGAAWRIAVGQRPDHPAGHIPEHRRDRDPVPRRRRVESAGRPAHSTRDPPGARCGQGTHIGLPPGESYPHLVAGGDGILPDESG